MFHPGKTFAGLEAPSFVVMNFASLILAPLKSAFSILPPRKFVPDRLAFVKSTLSKLVLYKDCVCKIILPEKSIPERSRFSKFTLLNSRFSRTEQISKCLCWNS